MVFNSYIKIVQMDAMNDYSQITECSLSSTKVTKKEGVSKLTQPLFYAQSPDFLKPGLCYFLKFLYL